MEPSDGPIPIIIIGHRGRGISLKYLLKFKDGHEEFYSAKKVQESEPFLVDCYRKHLHRTRQRKRKQAIRAGSKQTAPGSKGIPPNSHEQPVTSPEPTEFTHATPNDQQIQPTLADIEAKREIGNEKYRDNKLDDAIRAYSSALEMAKQINCPDVMAKLYFNLAASYRKLSSFDQAINECVKPKPAHDSTLTPSPESARAPAPSPSQEPGQEPSPTPTQEPSPTPTQEPSPTPTQPTTAIPNLNNPFAFYTPEVRRSFLQNVGGLFNLKKKANIDDRNLHGSSVSHYHFEHLRHLQYKQQGWAFRGNPFQWRSATHSDLPQPQPQPQQQSQYYHHYSRQQYESHQYHRPQKRCNQRWGEPRNQYETNRRCHHYQQRPQPTRPQSARPAGPAQPTESAQATPDDQQVQPTLADMEAQKEVGNEKYKDNKLDDAIRAYRSALAMGKQINCPDVMAKLHFNLAMTYCKLNSFNQAMDECVNALKYDPNYLKVHIKRAEIYTRQRKFDEAVICYEHICQIDTGNQDYKRILQRTSDLASMNSKRWKDHHKILGLSPEFSHEDLKKAYRQKALCHHPDRHSNGDVVTKKIEEMLFKHVSESHLSLKKLRGYQR